MFVKKEEMKSGSNEVLVDGKFYIVPNGVYPADVFIGLLRRQGGVIKEDVK